MSNKLTVTHNGATIQCRRTESLGYNHDVGAHAAMVMFEGEEKFVVQIKRGLWRLWTPADRAKPLVEFLRRKAQQS